MAPADEPAAPALLTALGTEALDHLTRLRASWNLVADLSFADLNIYAPVAGSDAEFVLLVQFRPLNSRSLYPDDLVGHVYTDVERPLVARAWRTGDWASGEPHRGGSRVQAQAVPIRLGALKVGVVTREAPLSVGLNPSPLERAYLDAANELLRMVADGVYPFPGSPVDRADSPRLGDGFLRLDAAGRVTFASPNAVSHLHRIGYDGVIEGCMLPEYGMPDSTLSAAFATGTPVLEDLDFPKSMMQVQAIPLLAGGRVSGALLMLRDVSELRRRDRLLLSKDATIREVHHRVKNNLQTIASLLRLAGRRLASEEAKEALDESVRRIRAIAVVHDLLSQDATEQVDFRSIARKLVRMVEDALVDPERHLVFTVTGSSGLLPAEVATPLAVVVTELIQNAVDHAFAARPVPGTAHVQVTLRREGHQSLHVEVADDGRGLPGGFVLGEGGLGLQIVETLVTSELNGTFSLCAEGDDGRRGTRASITVPLDRLE